MKKLLIILTLLVAATSLNAQRVRRGIALGADRDTLLYIIASPFDNWYFTARGGVQTFIGNEKAASARRNQLDWNAGFEVGKWIIPDLAVSVRLNAFSVHGQSQYPLQPFIDFTGCPTYVNPDDGLAYYEYQPFSATGFSLMGFVTLDWTNLLRGYENGKRSKFHVYTPIGLGASMLAGTQKNPNGDYVLGSFRRNFELAYSFILGAEYTFTPRFAVNIQAELFGSESTWDWSPYNNSNTLTTIFDVMPTVTVGLKFNLLRYITKRDIRTNKAYIDQVNHEFLSFGTRNTVNDLRLKIHELEIAKDSAENCANVNADLVNNLNQELMKLVQQYDDIVAQNDSLRRNRPSIMHELIDTNAVLNLPSTVVYFELDKYYLDYNARKRLETFAKEVKQLDDTIEFYLIGAADSLTGSIRHNQWLSEKRANVAYDMLVNKLGISGNQFIVIPVGGIVDYDPKEYNRMAMVIQRTPVTESIVNRWLRQREARLKDK